jgi:hypothetical protein
MRIDTMFAAKDAATVAVPDEPTGDVCNVTQFSFPLRPLAWFVGDVGADLVPEPCLRLLVADGGGQVPAARTPCSIAKRAAAPRVETPIFV